MARLVFERAGPASSIQDLGRIGFQNLGVCQTGAADDRLLKVANALVGNALGTACLEFSLLGPKFEVQDGPCLLSVAGDVNIKLNGEPIEPFSSFVAQPHDHVEIGGPKSHTYAYLAMQSGPDLPFLFNSHATHARAGMGGFKGRNLRDGDCLELTASADLEGLALSYLPSKQVEQLLTSVTEFPVVLGPQDDAFASDQIQKFLSNTYVVTKDTDRMGMRLDGEPIKHIDGPDILSDGIAPGSIQVPGSGLPIVLLSERQTIGGYTKIATVLSSKLGALSQVRANANLKFVAMSPSKAVLETRKEHEKMKGVLRAISNLTRTPNTQDLLSANLVSGAVNAKTGEAV